MKENGEAQWSNFYNVTDERIRHNLAEALDKIEDALVQSVNNNCNIKLIAKIRKLYLDLKKTLK